MEQISKAVEFVVKDTDDEQRRIFGWGYQAKNAQGEQVVDWSGEVIDTRRKTGEYGKTSK